MQTDHAAAPEALQSPSAVRDDRLAVACQVLNFERARAGRGDSIRTYAAHHDLKRTTLQDRILAARDDGLPAGYSAFFETDVGHHFALKLVVSVLVLFVLRAGCSVETVALFFQALGLQRFLASSPSSLRRLFDKILAHTERWGQLQFERLAPSMPKRDVVLALDENFHWDKMLLVLMDTGSGFLFGEEQSDSRDAQVWENTVRTSLEGYNVSLCAVTRDGGTWLGACAQRLNVPAGPDVFHIQHGVCKASARPMALRVTRAKKALEQSERALTTLRAERALAAKAPRPRGRPLNWEGREQQAEREVAAAKAHVTTMEAEREAMRSSIRALGDAHHPVDLVTGESVSAEQVRERLQNVSETMAEHAARANLGRLAIQALNGVFSRLDELSTMVGWWHRQLRLRLERLPLPEGELKWVERALMPALYVHHRISLGRDAEARASLKALWERLRLELESSGSPWRGWPRGLQQAVQRVVQSWVRLFPRSTSGLEGHNGQDSLCQHQRHRLSPAFRRARIVVRNYVICRPDGTTAAQRLFGKAPSDLIEHLCQHIKLPGRGRRRQPRENRPILALTA